MKGKEVQMHHFNFLKYRLRRPNFNFQVHKGEVLHMIKEIIYT